MGEDGKNVFEGSHLVWYDKPYVHSMKVTDEQIIKLHADWQPFDSNSVIN